VRVRSGLRRLSWERFLANGLFMEHAKPEAIRVWSPPKRTRHVQCFLGMVNVVLRGRGAPGDVPDGDGRSRKPDVAAGLRAGGGGRGGGGRPRPQTPRAHPCPRAPGAGPTRSARPHGRRAARRVAAAGSTEAFPAAGHPPEFPSLAVSSRRIVIASEGIICVVIRGGAGPGQLVAPVPRNGLGPHIGRRATTVVATVVAGK